MIFAIVAAILAYRKAKDTGRNGFLWAAIAVVTFIGTQFLIALGLGIIIGLFVYSSDQTTTDIDKYNILITIVAVIFSFGTTWLVLKYLDRVSPEDNFTTPPPPPTNFN